MNRALVVAVIALTLFGLTVSSAAYLAVDGGVLQIIREQVSAPVPPSPTPENCTHTPVYYRNHPESWPVDQLSLGGTTYSQPFLLSILNMPAVGDVSIGVAQALIAAKLNTAQGVDTLAIAATLDGADGWLAAHPFASHIAQEDWQLGLEFLRQLEQYNNGEAGPALCPGDDAQQITFRPTPAFTSTPTITPTATATTTATATPTVTWTPSATPPPTPQAVVFNFDVLWQDASGAPLLLRPPLSDAFSIDLTSPGRAAQCRYFGPDEPLRCSYVYYDAEGRADGLWLQSGAPYTVVASGVPDPFAAVSGLGDFVAGATGCDGVSCMHIVTFRENAPAPTATPEETATDVPTATALPSPTSTPAATATPTATQPATAEVLPRLQCVAALDDERRVAFFDYSYEATEPRTIAAGPHNFLTPAGAEGAVPTIFSRQTTAEWPDHRFAVIFESERLTWTVEGRSASASPGSPACAQMVEVNVLWMHGVSASAVLPANVGAGVLITAESDLGTAVCRGGPNSSQQTACRYQNDVPQPLPRIASLWVVTGERYRVTIEGLPPQYRALGMGTFELADLECDRESATCEHTVTIFETAPERGTPTPWLWPTATPTETPTRVTPTPTPPASATPVPTPTASSTPQPTSTEIALPTATALPTASATAPAATPTPTISPTPTATLTPAATPTPTMPPTSTATWTPSATPTPPATPTIAAAPTLSPTPEASAPPSGGAP